MKYLLLVIGLIIAVSLVAKIVIAKTNSKIETLSYKLVKTYDNFEIRTYEASLFSYVNLPKGGYSQNSSQGFRLLAGYIFGANKANEKIAMTSPVTMPLNDSIGMMFKIPSQYKLNDLPKPNNSEVQFKQEKSKTVAVITFGGWANDLQIEKNKNFLISELKKNNISHNNSFSYMGYNPPYELIYRKNEIAVEIDLN